LIGVNNITSPSSILSVLDNGAFALIIFSIPVGYVTK
jgi:hypothetical protein